jgi:transglutaminase-like putative cysteine protease
MFKFLFFILLTFSLVFALNPFTIGSSIINANLSYVVSLNGQTPQTISLKLFGFYNTSAQDVILSSALPSTSSSDSFLNNILTFQLNPQLQSQEVDLNLLANVSYLNWIGFGSNDPQYLMPSQYVIITPEISQAAQQIVGNESNPFKKIVLLTSWVHNNVKYEGAGLSTVIMNSSWVFDNRVGKCSEFTHLFIAMARSVGIPAKFIAGFVFNGNSWALHAWAEVYVGGEWYPVDPTFDEALILDASHVEMASGVDQSVVNNIISGSGNFNISDVSLVNNLSAGFLSTSNFSIVSVSISTPSSVVGSNSFETIKAVVKNNIERGIATPVFLSVPEGVTVLSDSQVLVYVPAFGSETVSWNILTPEMKENYVYNYTVEADFLGGSQKAFFTGSSKGSVNTVEGLQLSPLIVFQNSSFINVVSKLSNTGSVGLNLTETAFFENQSQQGFLNLTGGQSGKRVFIFPFPENNQSGFVLVQWSGGNYTQNFTVVLSPPPSNQSSPSQSLPLTQNLQSLPLNEIVLGLTVTFLFLIVLIIIKRLTRS